MGVSSGEEPMPSGQPSQGAGQLRLSRTGNWGPSSPRGACSRARPGPLSYSAQGSSAGAVLGEQVRNRGTPPLARHPMPPQFAFLIDLCLQRKRDRVRLRPINQSPKCQTVEGQAPPQTADPRRAPSFHPRWASCQEASLNPQREAISSNSLQPGCLHFRELQFRIRGGLCVWFRVSSSPPLDGSPNQNNAKLNKNHLHTAHCGETHHKQE